MGGTPAGVSGKHTGGSNTAGGTENMGGDQSMGGEPAVGGLTVTITSPTAATDPNKDDVIITDDVDVVCSVVAADSSVTVDGGSVMIELLDAKGDPVLGQDGKPIAAKGSPTGISDEYSVKLLVTGVDTGVVSFRCSATSVDKSSSGSVILSSLVDHGPTIVPATPEVSSAHALKEVMPVEFTVSPTPLSDDDEGAAVTKVTLEVAGKKIDALMEAADKPGTYRAQIDFSDGDIFKETPPEHTSVHIEATNSRKPTAVTAITDYPVVVDGVGPVVAYTSPKDNAAVHGETVVEFTIDDSGAGIDIDTLEISVSGLTGSPIKYDEKDTTRWTPRVGNKFKFRFDAASLKDVISQITVAIRVQDLAGNLTDGVTRLLYKDDLPPIIDLDPGMARARNAQDECSVAFDPMFDALNDLDKTNFSINLFRVLVYDQTNMAPGQKIAYMAGADRTSARLYVQPNPAESFLVDSNSDGVCDSLARQDFTYQSLTAIPVTGTLTFGLADQGTAPDTAGICLLKPSSSPPERLCDGHSSRMTAVIGHNVLTGGSEPVIYGVGALKQPECTGSQWDLHDSTSKNGVSLSADGWVCLAAQAKDALGNMGISSPLRICVDDPGVPGVPDCMNGAPAPSCTTNCTAPAHMPPNIYGFN